MNMKREIEKLDEHIASIHYRNTEGELKAQILIAKAGLLQAEATRQLTEAVQVAFLDSLSTGA